MLPAQSANYGFDGGRPRHKSPGAFPVPLQQRSTVAPRLGRYAADVQFEMICGAFDCDQFALQRAARVIHLPQAALDSEGFVTDKPASPGRRREFPPIFFQFAASRTSASKDLRRRRSETP
jgi:hypothetical protein